MDMLERHIRRNIAKEVLRQVDMNDHDAAHQIEVAHDMMSETETDR